jgi:hypothetical protein
MGRLEEGAPLCLRLGWLNSLIRHDAKPLHDPIVPIGTRPSAILPSSKRSTTVPLLAALLPVAGDRRCAREWTSAAVLPHYGGVGSRNQLPGRQIAQSIVSLHGRHESAPKPGRGRNKLPILGMAQPTTRSTVALLRQYDSLSRFPFRTSVRLCRESSTKGEQHDEEEGSNGHSDYHRGRRDSRRRTLSQCREHNPVRPERRKLYRLPVCVLQRMLLWRLDNRHLHRPHLVHLTNRCAT